MSGNEVPHILEAFRTNWLSSVGPQLDSFEQAVAAYLGHDRHVLAVSSGTAALHLILRYIGIGQGDRVAVSTLTFAGSVFPIQYMGAQPVFLDSDKASANIDAALVEDYLRNASKAGKLPKALIVVHLYGQHADIDSISESCMRHGVILIEDAAESLGGTYHGRPTATTADYAILSFNGNKIITTTGGGMVVAKDPDAIAKMKKLANQSREPTIDYCHAELGYNYRMSNVLAAIGLGQLEVLSDRVTARRAVAERYVAAFQDTPGISLFPEQPWGIHTRWLSVFLIDSTVYSANSHDLVTALVEFDIEARPVWRPMHTQPLYAKAESIGGAIAEELHIQGICLPSSSSLHIADQEYVIERLQWCLDGFRY
jgi:pyridoxal phosphate-dependent aminotransferase EpsN